MSTLLPTITVPAHYSFLSCLKDDSIEDTCDAFEVEIVKKQCGDFLVRAPADKLLSFVEEICIDDEESVDTIMETMRSTWG